MTNSDLLRLRLANQHITTNTFGDLPELLSYLCAVQAQEYGSAKWALGLRMKKATHDAVERAYNDGHILRTHLMRPTWHFVAPADIRWLLQLTAPRVHAMNAYMYRQMELDEKVFKKSNDALVNMLEGGQMLTRASIVAGWERMKIKAEGIRLACLLMYAELEGIICSGPREGKQFTYALLEERVPVKGNTFTKDEALATIATRYFTSRGPATVRDFTWWSGLGAAEVKQAVAMLPKEFEEVVVNDQAYIFNAATMPDKANPNTAFLMPNFDEYGICYKDRSLMDGNTTTHDFITKNGTSVQTLIVDGKIAGTWKAVTKRGITDVTTTAYHPLSKAKQHAVEHAVEKYRSFIIAK
jgi:hypothetical protein